MLSYFRKMGSMEQIFTIFHGFNLKGSWGPIVGAYQIDNLNDIALDKIQFLWDKIHLKYESLQCQALAVPDPTEYDDLFIGCLPFKIVRDSEKDVNKVVFREANRKFPILNDCALSTRDDVENGQYKIENIPTLYRIFIVDDYLVMNINHLLCDGMSFVSLSRDFIGLLNNDKFIDKKIPYLSLEKYIDPKYAASRLKQKIENLIPTHWALRFGKFYATNKFLRKYNPLRLHRDDILLFRLYFDKDFLTFPLDKCDTYDFRINFKHFNLSKSVTKNIKMLCKLHNVHVSSLFQYVSSAALIEGYPDVLKEDHYKTIVYNAFSTIPMYKEQLQKQKIYLGVHACAYGAIVEYYKNVKLGTEKFWKIVERIDAQILNDDVIGKVYMGKFPFMNCKKFMRYAMDDEYNIFQQSIGAPLVSNPGSFAMNKNYYKYKVKHVFMAGGLMAGMGGIYTLGTYAIKGIDKMGVNFIYGTQYFDENMAENITNKIREKLEIIGSVTNYQSKL